MTSESKHLTEEELIEHYYGEDPAAAHVQRHLKACARCAEDFAALQRDLGGVKTIVPPARSESYGQAVWQSIRSSLPRYESRKRSMLNLWKPLVWATACALLVTTAFVAGRVWQRSHAPVDAAKTDPQARERVVVLVLGDHLDRSERLLVELNHANGKDSAPIQTEARDLLTANRLLRQSVKQSSDPEIEAALDRLERLLVEVANEPDGLSQADITRLRQQMNTDGLLFDVRVLRSRVTEQAPGGNTALKGTSI
jgi:hypothetical protein